MRFSAALISALATLPFGAIALKNKNGPFVLKLAESSSESVKTSLLAGIEGTIFNALSSPLDCVLTDVGVLEIALSVLLGDLEATVFYLTEGGQLYIEGTEAAAGAAGYSLNDQGQLLQGGEPLQAGFEGDCFKLKPKSQTTSSSGKRETLSSDGNDFDNDPITVNTFVPVTVDALDWNPAAPFLQSV